MVFVIPFICWLVRPSITFVELLQSFPLKFLKLDISWQPLVRKHSCLGHGYPGGSALIP